jgi:hypothetical protein
MRFDQCPNTYQVVFRITAGIVGIAAAFIPETKIRRYAHM